MQEIDNLNFETSDLKKMNGDLAQENIMQKEEIAKMGAVIRQIEQDKDQVGMNLLKLEQNKNQSIIEIKKVNNKLKEELDKAVDIQKRLEAALSSKDKDFNSLIDRH